MPDKLEQLVKEYETIFDAMPIMLWYKDDKNNMLRVNKAAADFDGVRPQDLVGKNSAEVYPADVAESFYKDDLEVIRTGKPKLNIVERHTHPVTGEEMWVQTGKVPYHDERGNIVGVIAFAVDITQQKDAESKIQEAFDKLEAKNRQMQRVHEFIRSTLTQLEEATQRGADNNEMRQYLKQVRQEFESIRK
jgi:PAS domain S-box-containing protein